MTIRIGTMIGAYEILSPLGAGGMGEVYLARDARLDRQVAIKVLPEAMTRDKERVARFEREAKLLASINHPNIAAIFGFEQRQSDAGPTHFLVMELVEGETLAQRLKSGALAVEHALDVAKQMAEALEAAHDKGIIHRDLKPANVMIRSDGTVKVLDFGLAKALAANAQVGSDPDSPTVTADATRPGVVLGTAPYMSPEQARGKPHDKRTDIWALGCVLYECLTGNRLFDGATMTDILAHIVTQEPDYDALPVDLPREIVQLLRRCLNKDPKRRLRDVREMRIRIEDALSGSGFNTAVVATPSNARTSFIQRRLPWLLLVIVAIAVAVSTLLRTAPPSATHRPLIRMVLALPGSDTIGWKGRSTYFAKVGFSRLIAISPDGLSVIYAVKSEGTAQLYIRNLGDFDAHPLDATENARAPFFSPDGRWVGFYGDNKHGLYKVPVSGGTPQKICTTTSLSFDASWAPDGKTIVFANDAGLWRVGADGGTADQLTRPDRENGEVFHAFPSFLPDNRSVLFTVVRTPDTHIALLDLETGEIKEILSDGSDARFLPTEQLVYTRGGELLVVRYDYDARETTGSSVRVVKNVQTIPGLAGMVVTHYAVSTAGTLVYVSGSRTDAVDELVWVDMKGQETPITQGSGIWMHPRLSPDGRRILIDTQSDAGMRDLFIYEIDHRQLRRLTNRGTCFDAFWSRDGRSVVFSAADAGNRSIFQVSSDFSGKATLLLPREHNQYPNCWSSDGKAILFHELYPDHGGGIWSFQPRGDSNPVCLLTSPANERWPILSTNGEWITYVADESGRREVFVQSFPELGARHRISIEGGGEPRWSPSDDRLFFRQDGQFFVVDVDYAAGFSAGVPRVLFREGYDAAPIGHQHYDISNDGKRFLMIKHAAQPEPNKVQIVLNWLDELNAKVLIGGGR